MGKRQASKPRQKSQPKKSAPPKRKAQEKSRSESSGSGNSGSSSGSGRSGSSGSNSQSGDANDEVIFNKNTFIAFVDPSGELDAFSLGLVLEDHREVDEEVLVDVYEETGRCKYTKAATKVPIAEHCIIGAVAIVKPKAKKGKVAAEQSVTITQQNYNSLNLLMENVVAKLKESESSSSGSGESEDEESEKESSGEDKETQEQIRGRRIVGVKKGGAAQGRRAKSAVIKQPSKSQSTRSKPQGRGSKKNQEEEKQDSKKRGGNQATDSKKSRGAGSKKRDDDEENKGDEDMNEESGSALVQLRKSVGGKRGGTAAKKNTKALTQVPELGKKRRARSKLAGSGSEGEDEDDEGDMKKKNLGGGKSKSVKPSAKKVPKMPTEFKKGKWNPDVELIETDLHKEGDSDKCYFDCCIRCNNKNVIRAALTANKKLLANCLSETKLISLLTAYWSPEVQWTALEYMVLNNEHDLMEILLHPKVKVPQHSTYEQERNLFYGQRANNPQYLLNFVDSGMVSHMAYGAKVRRVQMTRGNKQGNNAFLEYEDNPNNNPAYYICDENFIKRIFSNPGQMTTETFQILYKLNSQIENSTNSLVYEAVRAGNRKIAYELVKNLVKFPNWGFNNLHLEALGKSIEQERVLKASVFKKANTNQDLTPFHCACINPNPKIIKQFLDVVNNELDVPDTQLRRPVHYAAANENPEILKLLIAAGAPLSTLDNQKTTCLHIAAMTGRASTARLILETAPNLLHLRTKQSMTPIAFACQYGHLDVVKVLVEFKAKINVGSGPERFTPIQWAAAYGHYDLCEYLVVEAKARVLGKDKYKRTALTMAVRNGHTKIASLLLQRGSEWDHPDSSANTPLHYAAAYGWLDGMNLLLKTGADVNAQNSWRITPINIAMLKNHQGCVKRLLDEPNVDVNCKDEKGRTLLMLALYQLNEESESFIKYLLKKGANPNIVDLEGQTILHYIAKYKHRNSNRTRKTAKKAGHSAKAMPYYNQAYNQFDNQMDNNNEYQQRIVEIQKNVALILIESGVDLSHKDNNDRTAFAICLENDNAVLLNLLKDQISFNAEPELFFAFSDKILNTEYQKIMLDIIENDPPTVETINYLDPHGLTPFLDYLQVYTTESDSLLHDIILKVNQQLIANGNNTKDIKITNHDLFNVFIDATGYHTHNPGISQEQKEQIAKEILIEVVLLPFIELVRTLVEKGANPHAQVQKLKRFREKELNKLKEIEEIKVKGPKKELEEERVKKRKELRRGRQNQYTGFGACPQKTMAVKEEEDLEDISGKQKPQREYGQDGLRNAFHIIVECPEPKLVELLVDYQINSDQPDYDGVTPFNLISKSQNRYGINKEGSQIWIFRQQLISLDVRIDFPDKKGRTPFLNYYGNRESTLAGMMLDLGANVNQMDNGGLFALKYALIRRDNLGINYLLERGANINQIDNKGRNLLHHAVNMSSSTADATFETEQFLIEKGVELNLKDSRGRTPLHYAFVKISNWRNNAQIDPIETVSSLCGYKKLELDVADKWLKTPLHYASQRGASCCAMYLVEKGASSEKIDIYGNTPLGVCLLNHHYNYGILLIQAKSNVNARVFRENPEEIAKKWKAEKLLYKKTLKNDAGGLSVNTEDHDMSGDEDDDENSKQKSKSKAHRAMFNSNRNVPFGRANMNDDYDEESYGDEDYGEDDYGNENAFNQQNAFGINVYAKKSVPRKAPRKAAAWGSMPQAQQQQYHHNQMAAGGQQPISAEEKEGCSLFKLSIRAGQQGLAYLMMNNGYDLMLCIQDAMDEKKFLLVLTLLQKTAEDEIVQKKNKKQQNLFHILSMNSSACQLDHLVRIYQALTSRGVDCKAKDTYQRTALHYAVISGSQHLVGMLLTQPNPYNPNEVDIYGHNPLSLCLKGKKAAGVFHSSQQNVESMFSMLVKHGADVNFIYPEEDYKPVFTDKQIQDDQYGQDYDSNGPYKCSILINIVRLNRDYLTIMRENILGLLKYGVKLGTVDSDGRDALMYAIINNNEPLVKMLLDNSRNSPINKELQDKIGKSHAHYVVNPLDFGSYENIKILKMLQQAGFNLKLKDNQNKAPAQYAQEQESGTLLKEFTSLLGRESVTTNTFRRALSIVDTQHWPKSSVDYELDSETFMQIAQEKEELEHKDKKVPVDPTGNFEKSYEVYYDDDGKPWDVYLVKVDLKNGIYGDYVFYKMQILYDTNRDLYVVFTRYGRIGEDGMNQRSPFNNVAEAKEDFSKIFKSKTGNVFTDLENFSKLQKKYNIARINYITADYKDYLQPFDYEKCPVSKLHKEIYDLFEEISNITIYQRAMNSFGVDTNVLPFSGIKKEVIISAKEILGRIQEALKEDAEISKAGIKADYEQLTAVKEKISQLSSEYYELIPLANYKNSIAPPLSHQHSIKLQYDNLENLTYIELASKILLGAVFRQKEINPVDYVYKALNLLIEPLDKNGPEYDVIRTYINNTKNGQETDQKILNIFKIQRKGEAEVMQQYKDLANHLLLFHGSQLFNFLGILQQGMRIAPPEAPPTGYLFGKGVYFADMYEKSANYNYHTYHQQESSLMLLCEVALGKSMEVLRPEYVEELPQQYQSLKAQGRTGPDYDNMLILPNGTQIPYGKLKDYYANHVQQLQQQQQLGLAPQPLMANPMSTASSLFGQNVFGAIGQGRGAFGHSYNQLQAHNQNLPQLANNEYVVYNTSQIRMRYLIQMKKPDDKQ